MELVTSRWFAVKRKAHRKELTNALKLWQKSGFSAESREIIRARAASRVSEWKCDLGQKKIPEEYQYFTAAWMEHI